MKRYYKGHSVTSGLMLVFLLIASTSAADIMTEYVRLQPVVENLEAPTSIALDRYEGIYVVEASNNRILVYSQNGEYIKNLTGLDKPISVGFDGRDRIYIGNKEVGNVEVYDTDLNLLFKLGSGDGEFEQPVSIAITTTDKIYVADSLEDKVKVYNSDGTLSFTFGSTGAGDGEFNFPTAVAINESAGELIVADRQLNADFFGDQIEGARIQVFDLDGEFKRSFGAYGVGEGLLTKPVGAAMDDEGRIYVADAMQHVVHVFDGSDGTSLGYIHNEENPMRTPLHIAYGSSNRLFIASLNTGKIEIYGKAPYISMQASPLTLDFAGEENNIDPASQNVVVTNNGTETLNWTARTGADWITLSAASGSATVSGTSTLSIGIDLSGRTAGTYMDNVTISSGVSAAAVVTVNLTVSPAPEPLAADAGGPYSAVEGAEVVLDGSGSGGTVSLYEWDVDNDGTYEYSTASATQIHTYTQSGAYTVRLRVTDAASNISGDTASAAITDSLPTAGFTATSTSGSGPLTVTFTNSSTGYDEPLTYAWDFDGDWISDSELENPSYVFQATGTYTITMTVTDSDGSTDTLSRTNYITVTPGSELEGCSNSPIKRASSYYSTVQSAYNAAANGEIIKLHYQQMSSETLSLERDVTVTVKGGYNCDYSGVSGTTTINGNITITTGTLILEDIILQ